MSEVLDFTGDHGFCPGGFLYRKPHEPSLLLSLGRHVDMCSPRKRSRVTSLYVVPEEPKSQPSIDILPDECLFEIFRRLPFAGGRQRAVCASVSKRWLMLLSTICRDEICTTVKNEPIDLDAESQETDPHGFLSRCLEGTKASDVRLAAISVCGGVCKLSLRGNNSTRRLTDFGLKAISRGCPSLKALALWNLSSVGDDGLSAIAAGCRSLKKLDLTHCPAITDKGLLSITTNCPDLISVTLESCPNIGDKSLNALARSCRNLNSITLKNCPLIGDRGITDLFTSTGNKLTKANLLSLSISDISLAVIGHYGSALTDLALGDLRNVNERGFWVMGKGRGLPKLKSLSITSCPGASDMGLDAIGQCCSDLKTISLRKCPLVSDNGVVLLAKAAGSLESLKLEETHRVTLVGVFGVLVINSNRKLKSLAVINCMGVKDSPIQFSSSVLSNSLRSLTIRNCPGVGDFGLGLLGRLCPNLTHVDLTGLTRVTDAGVYPLVQRPDTSLVKATLSGCEHLTDNIVSRISEIHGDTLKILNLDGCKNVGDSSLMAVAKNCSVLCELDVSRCGITDDGIGMLARAERLGIQILSLAGCPSVSGESVPFLGQLGKTLLGLNIKHCSRISSTAVNLLIEQLWRCDILS